MKDKQYWLALTERYFEAQTTDDEELALKRFAAQTADPDFDQLRAVLGLAAAAHRYTGPIHRSRSMLPIGIAAALLLVFGLSLFLAQTVSQGPADCIAYVNGQRITDEAQVFGLMTETMGNINQLGSEGDPIESQLEMMFNDL